MVDQAQHDFVLAATFGGNGGAVRIAAESGAVIVFQTALRFNRLPEVEELELGVNIMITDPWRSVTYRNRPMSAADFASLYRFLQSAMQELHPEISVPAFDSASAGVILSVATSSELDIELDVTVVQYQGEPEPDLDHTRVQVARAALWEPADIAKAIAETFGPELDQIAGS